MKVLIVEPMKPCYVREISGLNDMQEIVGGHRPRVYKIPMVRMFAVAGGLTNPRMYGSIRRPYRNVWVRSSAAGVV